MRPRLLLLLLAAILLLPGTGLLPLMDRDEPRFAHATLEMAERGEWAIPYFNGQYRFDKPPLTYWAMSLGYLLCGDNELGARLHSVLAAAAVALALFSFARRIAAPSVADSAGLLAGVTWLLSLQTLVHGRLAVADMPMILFVLLIHRALYELLAPSDAPAQPLRWLILLYASVALGFLAKGPIALAVPLLSVLLWRFAFWRRPLPWSRLHLFTGLLAALSIVALWGIPALVKTNGLFWKVGIGEHVVERGAQVFNGRLKIPVIYYFLTVFLSLLPWSLYGGALWRQLRPAKSTAPADPASPLVAADPSASFLLAWFAAPFLIFTLYATQLPHYIMPGFPAFALLLARSGQLPALDTPFARRWAVTVLGVFTFVGLLLLSLATLLPWSADLSALRVALVAASALPLAGVLLGIASLRRNYPLAAVAVLALALSLHFIGERLRACSPAIQVAALLPENFPASATRTGVEFAEPSLVFYAGHPWTFNPSLSDAKINLARPGPALCVFLRREWTLDSAVRQLRSGGDTSRSAPGFDHSAELDALDLSAYNLRTVSGFNLARSSWVELTVAVKP